MIVETLIATVGVVMCGALWLADRVLKRQREEDRELDVPLPIPDAKPLKPCGKRGQCDCGLCRQAAAMGVFTMPEP